MSAFFVELLTTGISCDIIKLYKANYAHRNARICNKYLWARYKTIFSKGGTPQWPMKKGSPLLRRKSIKRDSAKKRRWNNDQKTHIPADNICAKQAANDDQKGGPGAIQKENGKADKKACHPICDHRRRLCGRKGAYQPGGYHRGSADKTEEIMSKPRSLLRPRFFLCVRRYTFGYFKSPPRKIPRRANTWLNHYPLKQTLFSGVIIQQWCYRGSQCRQ